MHNGGLIFASASNADGKIQSPSPHIKPDATAGTICAALLLSIMFQMKTTKLPTHMSIAKLAPTRKGTPIAIGRGTHLPYLGGNRSLIRLATTAKPKNP
jgi:hypothetical protein